MPSWLFAKRESVRVEFFRLDIESVDVVDHREIRAEFRVARFRGDSFRCGSDGRREPLVGDARGRDDGRCGRRAGPSDGIGAADRRDDDGRNDRCDDSVQPS